MKIKGVFSVLIMFLLIGCNKKTYTGSIYLAQSSLKYISVTYQDLIEYQALSKECMNDIPSGIEIIVKDDKAIEAFAYGYGRRYTKEELKPFNINTSKIDLIKNTLHTIKKSDNTESYLGGKKPEQIILPFLNNEIYFQYFGKLIKNEFPNNLLNFDLHLIAPIYDSFDKIYLDYSNEMAPKVINSKDLKISRTFNETNSNSEIVFTKTPIKFERGGSLRFAMGNTGVPSWIQHPEYPKCPISGDKMKFLTAFDLTESREQVPLETKNFEIEGYSKKYFENLNFWISGAIYVFINPKTKVVCYLLQTT
jgi:hypothetical protein